MMKLFSFLTKKRFNLKDFHAKQLRSMRNWKYYQRHRDEILRKRKERYRLTGK